MHPGQNITFNQSKKTRQEKYNSKCFEFHFMNQFDLVTEIEYFNTIAYQRTISELSYHIIRQ
jgi:hypothetical protein